MTSKLSTLAEAVKNCIPSGSSVVMGACLEQAIPFAVSYEMIRQKVSDLDLIAPISDMSADLLIGMGLVRQITGAWVGNVSGGLGHNYRRAFEKQLPRKISVRDHSNFSLTMALTAGAYGMPYMPFVSLLGSDIVKSNPEFKIAQNPFEDQDSPVVLVPPLKPDVAVLSVQRSDVEGNAHFWGNLGLAQEAALAAKKVLLLAEEIVSKKQIQSDPNRVLIPSFKVEAVIEAKAGQHPSPLTGYWKRDTAFFDDYHRRSRDPGDFQKWVQEWVFDTGSHDGYLRKLELSLVNLRIKNRQTGLAVNYAED